jgi:hypothetical protein
VEDAAVVCTPAASAAAPAGPSARRTAAEVYELVRAETARRTSRSGTRLNGQARACHPHFRAFIQDLLDNTPTVGECGGRVLRLKPTLDLNTTELEIDMVLEALRHNFRVECLYIHNFEDVRRCCLHACVHICCWLAFCALRAFRALRVQTTQKSFVLQPNQGTIAR